MPRGIPNKKPNVRAGFKVNRKLYDSLVKASSVLVMAYANGLSNGGSIDWTDVDRAHEHALRSQRMLLRARKRR